MAIDGDVRAYPKRILAWHEMVKDRIAGRELNGVYCTLCGAMILYDTTVNGVHHELGTSGFLYRSNKLMYDQATKSMWSTLSGTPVVGALAGQGIELQTLYVVTTTWKEWKKRHPNTSVLSLDTGHARDYREGAAYADYFATDKLMFGVPKLDARLPNKAEVLALRSAETPGDPLAISADLLMKNRVSTSALARATSSFSPMRAAPTACMPRARIVLSNGSATMACATAWAARGASMKAACAARPGRHWRGCRRTAPSGSAGTRPTRARGW